MVVTGPFPSAGPMKAPPQTAIPNECPGWDITPVGSMEVPGLYQYIVS